MKKDKDRNWPVVILCGGLGMRLREETEFKPKPMVQIGNRPILWHIMNIYAYHGFKRFILCLGYKGEIIRNYFLNYRTLTADFTLKLSGKQEISYHTPNDIEGWEITFVDTGISTNTGGRIKKIERFIDTERFLLTYGDGVTDLNINDLIDFHLRSGTLATVTGFNPVSRFGIIESGKDGRVVKFSEKPKLNGLISGGFFVLEKGIFHYLTEDSIFEKEPLESLTKENKLSVFIHNGFWFSVDTYRDFLEINRMWERGETPWKIW